MAPYPSLAEFAATWSVEREERPPWAHPTASEPPTSPWSALATRQLEDVLDTIVAMQRADWLQGGIYAGPHAMPDAWRDVLHASRTLKVAIPPAVVSSTGGTDHGVFGTNERAFLHLNSFFLAAASQEERRFVVGRLCGAIALGHVTTATLWAMLVDHGGLRSIASQALGPALEVLMTPLSLGARVALSRWHRAAAFDWDRAGALCAHDDPQQAIDAAGRSLLRIALGVSPNFAPADYLDQRRAVQEEGSPGRFAELLSARPWMYKRMLALERFVRTEAWVAMGRKPLSEPVLTNAELDRETAALLQVG